MNITYLHWSDGHEPYAELVEREWGEKFREKFASEIREGLGSTGRWEVYGIESDDGKAIGVGALVKSEMDYGFWQITWVVVHPAYRKIGAGSLLIKHMENYVLKEGIHRYSTTNAIMECTTAVPDFYKKLGYKSVFTFGKNKHLMVKNLKE